MLSSASLHGKRIFPLAFRFLVVRHARQSTTPLYFLPDGNGQASRCFLCALAEIFNRGIEQVANGSSP
jgi:hypothetical protein